MAEATDSPASVEPRRGGRSAARSLGAWVGQELAAAAVAVLGPAVHSRVLDDPGLTLRLVVIGAVASLTIGTVSRLGRSRGRWAPSAPVAGVAVVASLLGLGIAYRFVGAWLGAGLIFAQWAVRGVPPVPGFGVPRPAVRAGACIPWFAAVLHARSAAEQSTITYYAVTMLGAFLVLWIGATFPHQVEAITDRVGSFVGTVFGAVAFFLLGLVTLPVSWLIGRTGRKPLDPSSIREGSWGRREVHLLRAPSAFADLRYRGYRSPWRILGVIPGALLLVGLGMGSIRLYEIATGHEWKPTSGGFQLTPGGSAEGGPSAPTDEIPPAMKRSAWYPKYREDIGWMINQATAFKPLAPVRLVDVRSEYVNVADSSRKTWTPPSCSCTRLTVWLYGGSTAFGLDQRDEYTIASYLARDAAEDGLILDVVNKGVLGDMHWQEAQRFQWDLSNTEPPDLVVFYDGVNEIWGTSALENQRLGDSRQPYEPLTEEMWAGILRTAADTAGEAPEGVSIVDVTKGSTGDALGLGQLVATRYLRSLKMSADVAAANDVPIAWFWQPTRVSRPPIKGEVNGSTKGDDYAREVYDTASARVRASDEVTDLSDVLDDNDDPLFTDDVHHNEAASRIIAENMYRSLRPQLTRLSESKGAQG